MAEIGNICDYKKSCDDPFVMTFTLAIMSVVVLAAVVIGIFTKNRAMQVMLQRYLTNTTGRNFYDGGGE